MTQLVYTAATPTAAERFHPVPGFAAELAEFDSAWDAS